MLRQLRNRKVARQIMKGVLILVIPSFVLLYGWGTLENQRFGQADSIAQVRAPGWLPWPFKRWQSVTLGEYGLASERLRERRLMEAQLAGDYMAYFELTQGRPTDLFTPAEIIREALYQRILAEEADREGAVITRDELRNLILQMFPQDTKRQFAEYRRQRGITEEQFVAEVRQNVQSQSVLNQFLLPSRVSLFEMWSDYTLQNDEMQLEYVRIDAEPFQEAVAVDEQALREYFAENHEAFRMPAQRKFKYVSVARQRVVDQVSITDEDARRYWEENKETNPALRSSPQTHARHILLKYDPDTPTATEELRSRMEDIRAQASAAPERFADLANQYSEDDRNRETLPDGTEALKGGDIGWVGGLEGRAEWGDMFVDAAIGLAEKGQISQVIAGLEGLHIIQAVDLKPSEALPFEGQTIDIAREAVKQRAVREEVDRLIQSLRDAVAQATTLEGVADLSGLEVQETDLIDAGNFTVDPLVGSLAADDSYIEDLEIGAMSQVLIRTSGDQTEGAVVLTPVEKKDSRLPELDEVRDTVEAFFRAQRGLELAEEKATQGLEASREPGGLESWAQDQGLSLDTTDFFKRSGAPADLNETIDNLPALTFRTPAGAVRKSTLSLNGQPVGWIVWRVKELRPPTVEDFGRDYAAFQRGMVELKRMAMYEEWLRDESRQWDVKFPKEIAG